MIINLTKEFSFEMAHALKGYDGACKNIHGHSYKLLVTICGEPNSDENSPKYGMVMDFGDLKAIINKTIIEKYDHALVLNKKHDFGNIQNTKLVIVSFQPTCENLLVHFSELIIPELPSNIKLGKLRLHETATSYAEICF